MEEITIDKSDIIKNRKSIIMYCGERRIDASTKRKYAKDRTLPPLPECVRMCVRVCVSMGVCVRACVCGSVSVCVRVRVRELK